MAPTRHRKIKRYIKFLAECRDPATCTSVVKNAPDGVIKCICNAALNAAIGDIAFTKTQIKKLRRHKQAIGALTQKGGAISSKKKILLQKGGGVFLPILLSTVLSALGSALFSK